jgi:hypothetical protein
VSAAPLAVELADVAGLGAGGGLGAVLAEVEHQLVKLMVAGWTLSLSSAAWSCSP